MASASLVDQLDDAIEIMLIEPGSPPPKVDLAIGELLGIAAELRMLPDPAFKAALKGALLKREGAGALTAYLDVRGRTGNQEQPKARWNPEDVLPSLLDTGKQGYPVHRGNFAISAAMHAALVALLVTAGLWTDRQTQLRPHATSMVLTGLVAPMLPASADRSGGGGGGGDRDKLTDSRGSLSRFAREQLTPPAIVVRNEQPKLPAEPTVIGPPAPTIPPTSEIGNPLASILQPLSNGTGSGGGIGSGSGGGVGSGNGPGFGPGWGGGTGGGAFRVGGGVSAPHATYAPDPEYSDEARQAKYQGTVLLWLVVGADGRPRDIRVQRSLGMGLDEKAIEAVQRWRFEPSMKDGHPVSFRLY
jgi:periplasmic protein TonB